MRFIICLKNEKKIEVATKDHSSGLYKSGDHLKLKLNNGWRLPSIEELEHIYEQSQSMRHLIFKKEWYWSCSSIQISWDYYENLGINFLDGNTNARKFFGGSYSMDIGQANIRLVRDYVESF